MNSKQNNNNIPPSQEFLGGWLCSHHHHYICTFYCEKTTTVECSSSCFCLGLLLLFEVSLRQVCLKTACSWKPNNTWTCSAGFSVCFASVCSLSVSLSLSHDRELSGFFCLEFNFNSSLFDLFLSFCS